MPEQNKKVNPAAREAFLHGPHAARGPFLHGLGDFLLTDIISNRGDSFRCVLKLGEES